MKEVLDFIKECGVYYLATIENDLPKVRPFGTAEEYEGRLYIQTGKKKDCFKQLLDNPNAELCCYKGDKWLRLSGKLIPDDCVSAKKDMLDKNPSLRSMYDENDDNTIVLYFENAVATFYSFSDEPKTIEF